MDYYKVLELDNTASISDIKKSYRKLVKLYHPDKNKDPEAINKFHQIQTAYEILSDDNNRKEYIQVENKSIFQEFMDKIMLNETDIEYFKNLGYNIKKSDIEQINNLSIKELISFFVTGRYKNKNFTNDNNIDTETDTWYPTDANYFSELPYRFQRYNELMLVINVKIDIQELFNNNQRELEIKRKVNGIFITTRYKFNVTDRYIVFIGGGDSKGNEIGDLVIRLILPDNYEWFGDRITFNKDITLYQYIYGIELNIKLGNKNIKYDNWNPSRDGNLIEINKKFIIKLNLIYIHDKVKKDILITHFN